MHFEVYQDAKNEWRWRLHAANGRVIADSAEGYNRQGDCIKGITLVKGSASIPIRVTRKPTAAQLAAALIKPRM